MTEQKKQALETIRKVKEIYDNEGGELLCGGFWSEFMKVCDKQIEEIERTCC